MKNKFCGECGTRLSENARFCGECGTAVYDTEQTRQPAEKENSHSENVKSSLSQQKDKPIANRKFSTSGVLYWTLTWATVWGSLYFVQVAPHFDYINPLRLLSWLIAGGVSGTVAGVLLQRQDFTNQNPPFSALKKPVVIWAICWCALLALSTFRFFSFQIFFVFMLLITCGFNSYLIWTVLPLITDSSQLNFEKQRKNTTIYWGALGILATVIQKIFISFFYIY